MEGARNLEPNRESAIDQIVREALPAATSTKYGGEDPQPEHELAYKKRYGLDLKLVLKFLTGDLGSEKEKAEKLLHIKEREQREAARELSQKRDVLRGLAEEELRTTAEPKRSAADREIERTLKEENQTTAREERDRTDLIETGKKLIPESSDIDEAIERMTPEERDRALELLDYKSENDDKKIKILEAIKDGKFTVNFPYA